MREKTQGGREVRFESRFRRGVFQNQGRQGGSFVRSLISSNFGEFAKIMKEVGRLGSNPDSEVGSYPQFLESV